MTASSWTTIVLAFLAVLLLPALGIMIRGAVKWTQTEDKLGALVDDVRELIADKDRTHAELLEQLRIDRQVTDRRLRYLEEFWMEQGRRHMTPGP